MSDPQPSPGDSRPRDFAGLYRATVAPLRRHLARILGNASEAQDVAHDAYVRVYPTVKKEGAEKPEALLYTTARRLAFNRLRRRRVAPFQPEAAPERHPAATPGVVQQVMARQEWSHLEQAIAQLPEGCRTVLLLRKIELLSHQEIADRLGIAISTVEKQHARALRLLRAALAVRETLPPPGVRPPVSRHDLAARLHPRRTGRALGRPARWLRPVRRRP